MGIISSRRRLYASAPDHPQSIEYFSRAVDRLLTNQRLSYERVLFHRVPGPTPRMPGEPVPFVPPVREVHQPVPMVSATNDPHSRPTQPLSTGLSISQHDPSVPDADGNSAAMLCLTTQPSDLPVLQVPSGGTPRPMGDHNPPLPPSPSQPHHSGPSEVSDGGNDLHLHTAGPRVPVRPPSYESLLPSDQTPGPRNLAGARTLQPTSSAGNTCFRELSTTPLVRGTVPSPPVRQEMGGDERDVRVTIRQQRRTGGRRRLRLSRGQEAIRYRAPDYPNDQESYTSIDYPDETVYYGRDGRVVEIVPRSDLELMNLLRSDFERRCHMILDGAGFTEQVTVTHLRGNDGESFRPVETETANQVLRRAQDYYNISEATRARMPRFRSETGSARPRVRIEVGEEDDQFEGLRGFWTSSEENSSDEGEAEEEMGPEMVLDALEALDSNVSVPAMTAEE